MSNKLVRVTDEAVEDRTEKTAKQRVPNGYYTSLNDQDEGITDGMLVLVTRIYAYSNDKTKFNVQFQEGNHGWHMELEEFERNFRPEPNGRRIRQGHIVELMDEIDQMAEETPAIEHQLVSFQPHVDDSGDVQADIPEGTEEAEVSALETPPMPPAGSALAPVQANALVKKAVALMRNSALKLQKELKKKQELLKAYISEQALALQEKAEALSALVKQAEAAIWTINLYLGKDEEIHQLNKGKPADKETPIVIRQKVHYMDEECAARAEEGGLDVSSLKEFDKWIVQPGNLNSVSPDVKCVIAIKPRRHKKDYGELNAWSKTELDKANNHTYFLIRNGENVYRIWTDFNISERIVPRRKELFDIFYSEDTDWKTEERVKRPLKPGSKEYMAAMKEARDTNLHYFRVMLILQGLIDRTAVFQPLPAPRINILDPHVSADWVQIIYDDQPETIITDGRPGFYEWLAVVNETMCVGQRIMGFFSFSGYSRDKYDTSEKEKRIHPPSANNPPSNVLYALEKKSEDGKGFYFYYDRGEIYKGVVERGWRREYVGYEQAEVRARCLVHRTDDFVVNYDSATIEDIRYYLKDRVNRQHYEKMFPLLTRAIELKEQEAKDEAPFKLLLVGQTMAVYSVSNEVAEAAVPELVRWWKFKNQNHRALLSDDSAALKMILDEFGVRRKRAAERDGINDDRLVQKLIDQIKKDNPTVILIAHKKGNEYVAFIAHNEENVYVAEQLWAINRSSNCAENLRVRLKEQKDWRTVDTRWERWEVLYKHERFDNWIRDSRKTGYLTDPERQRALEQGLLDIGIHTKNLWGKKDKTEYDADDWKAGAIPLGASLKHKDEFDRVVIYVCDREAIVPTERFASTRAYAPSIAEWKVTWKRTAGGELKFTTQQRYHCTVNLETPPWRPNYDGGYYEGRGALRVIWEDEATTAEILRQQREARLAEARFNRFNDTVREADFSVEKELKRIAETTAFNDFIAEHGDPDLWEDHKKVLTIKITKPVALYKVLQAMIDRNIPCDGMTVKELYDKGWELMQADLKADREAESGKRHYYRGTTEEKVPAKKPDLDPVTAAIVVKHRKLYEQLIEKPPPEEDDDE